MSETWWSTLRGAAALAALGPICCLPPAQATTVVPIEDARLVDTAPVIVVGKVEGELPPLGEEYVTRWLVTVEQVLKGQVPQGSIEVVVQGGENASGDRLHLFGAPVFRDGERALLFLAPRAGGGYRVFQFAQGAFHRVRAGGRAVAEQDFREVRVVGRRRAGGRRQLRDFDAFVDWIADRAAGSGREPDYRFRANRREMRALASAFTLYTHNGHFFRWFLFDGGGGVPWRRNGAQTAIPGGGAAEVARARAAWNDEPTTPVNLTDGGTTTADGGLRFRDSSNTILFGDPNDEVEEFSCSNGGTLARGGFYSFGTTAVFDGREFNRISEGDIVVNNGLECVLNSAANRSRWLESLMGHELGHTLGIGHSSESSSERNSTLRNALMYYALSRSDTRGARLNSDDVAALQTLYRVGGAVQPPGPPPPPGSCPAGKLCLLGGRFEVSATWENQFDGSSGTAGAIRASDVAGYFYFTDPRNYELIFKVLDFSGTVKVFYGQLTNLHFTITVRDKRSGTVKTYTNTAGDCGGLDENGFPPSAVVGQFRGIRSRRARSTLGSCHADADTMCLLNGRFAVEMTWRNQYDGSTGSGIPKKLTDLTGAFGFTSSANLELLVKTLQFPDRVLVIYGALSNLEYTLRITDTIQNRTKEYHNPAGQYCGGLDNSF